MTNSTMIVAERRSALARILLFQIGPLVVLTTLLTFAAWKTFPTWDDGWLARIEVDGTSIREQTPDRPLLGTIWQFLSDRNLLWMTGYAFHWLAWMATGLLTMGLWTTLFPNLRRYAVVVGCLAIAPILCTTSLTVACTMFTAQIPVLLVYAGVLILMRAQQNSLSRTFCTFSCIAAVALVAGASLLSDYTAPTVLVGTVLLLLSTEQMRQAGRSLSRRIVTATVFLASGAVGYLVYSCLTDAAFRPQTRPEIRLLDGNLLQRLVLGGEYDLSMLWRGMLGDLLHRIGSMEMLGSAGLLIVPLAGLMAAWVCRATRPQTVDVDNAPEVNIRLRPDFFALLFATAAGVSPFAIMNMFIVFSTTWTRLWFPVLPVVCCLNLYLLFFLLRPRRWWCIPAVIAFCAMYFTLDNSYLLIRERRNDAAWARQIESQLSEKGITVALFDFDQTQSLECDYELTARLTMCWPLAERRRFWAIPNAMHADRYVSGVAWDRSLDRPKIDIDIRGLGVKGPIVKFLWIRVRANGSLEIASKTVAGNLSSSVYEGLGNRPLAAAAAGEQGVLQPPRAAIRPKFELRNARAY